MNQNGIPPVLIYYNFQGQLQPIRNLFCYLGLPFLEVHADQIRKQKKTLPPHILTHVAQFKIDSSHLPALLHEKRLIYGQLKIAIYICKQFDRQQLLGTNIFTKVNSRLREILEIYSANQPESMSRLLRSCEFAAVDRSKEEIDERQKKAYEQVMNCSKYVRECCQYLDKRENKGYVFGELTLIDFFFMESCFYMASLFDHPDRVSWQQLHNWNPETTHFLQKPNVYYLKIMREYLARMTSEAFQIHNQKYLQSFSILCKLIGSDKAEGLRRIWVGDQKYLR